jgi:hypothetical protein
MSPRPPASAPRVWLALGALLLAAGCLGGGEGQVERVSEGEVLELVDRLDRFYDTLEGRSLDAVDTYDDARLRAYFRSDQEFSDYYASLASQVRGASFRHARASRVRIRAFQLPDPDTAVVRITLQGQHLRALRFWTLEVDRIDTWRHTASGWIVAPEKL